MGKVTVCLVSTFTPVSWLKQNRHFHLSIRNWICKPRGDIAPLSCTWRLLGGMQAELFLTSEVWHMRLNLERERYRVVYSFSWNGVFLINWGEDGTSAPPCVRLLCGWHDGTKRFSYEKVAVVVATACAPAGAWKHTVARSASYSLLT